MVKLKFCAGNCDMNCPVDICTKFPLIVVACPRWIGLSFCWISVAPFSCPPAVAVVGVPVVVAIRLPCEDMMYVVVAGENCT